MDAQAAVRDHAADLALVFDGDADRCFIIDERGKVVSPSVVTAMIARHELAREPGGTIVCNKITSRSVPEVVQADGGKIVITRVGHTFVKAAMAEHDAIFGGEHSAHYYFRDFWGADTGMLAALHVLASVGHADRPLSELVARFDRYAASGEINTPGRRPANDHGPGRGGVRRSRRARSVDGLTSLARTGGSTYDQATPSRCSGSMSKPPLSKRWRALRDETLGLIRA